MKKLIGLGLVAMMVMGLAGAASAADNKWTVQLRAGVLSGTTWANSQAATTIGVQPSAVAPGYHSTLASNGVGIFGVDPDPYKMANKDYRAFAEGQEKYIWNLKLATGASWVETNVITVGWWIPAATEALPTGPFTLEVFRNGQLVKAMVDNELYGTAQIKSLGTYTLGAGATENWQVVATYGGTVIPEPGSIVAMLSGLVGLAGYGIRRRK